ncbi:MAG: hypothetical protein QXU99_01885 [Candidatus Bathyarchaeia archaeon]
MDQSQIVRALLKPEAYDEEVGSINLVQTHISFVFLTRNYVYKVKKAVNFGFLDFTTLEKRRFYCEKEVTLNRRLCGDMYVGVVPINKAETFRINGAGETVEYAVKMKRLPDETMLNNLLDKGKVDKALIENIARVIANFHSTSETSKSISVFGAPSMIATNWRENFDQTAAYIGKTLTVATFEKIRRNIDEFIQCNSELFKKRIEEGRIRDCHGDMHSGNIFVADRIYIFDAIEFNDRFRFCDVASDVAFLAMDLDFKRYIELSNFFIERYIMYSGDKELLQLLPFYKCYRAYVRGKVSSFKLDDPTIRSDEKAAVYKDAKEYFKLAATYALKL